MFGVAIGGFFGAILRYQISEWIHVKYKKDKFVATFFVNSIGSFLLGLFISESYNDFATQLIAIGFLGAFTTFSTFSFEVVKLVEEKRIKVALLYIVSSCIVCIVFAGFGYLL